MNDALPPDELDIPALQRLGHSHFPEKRAEEFWEILLLVLEQDWETIEDEHLDGQPVPAEFRDLHDGQLSLWKALSWSDMTPGGTVGVLIHQAAKVYLPLVRSDSEFSLWLAPPLKKFTPKGAARACLKAFDGLCEDLGVLPLAAKFINHIPGLIGRDELKAVFAEHWDDDETSLKEYFRDAYREDGAHDR